MTLNKDNWRRELTEKDIDKLEELLETHDIPYLSYIHEFIDEDEQRLEDIVSNWAWEKGDRDSYPGDFRSWLSTARDAIQNGNTPPEPRSKYEDEDGHTYDKCLGCGAVFRDDEEKDCGCPVGTESVLPENA